MQEFGRRLRTIREQKGFTQQQLELELDASFGHISKIESGKVNPSKETILRIADILGLSQSERIILLGLNVERVSQEEVQKAKGYTAEYLAKSPHPAYLSDDLWFAYYANGAFLKLIGVGNDPATKEKYEQQFGGLNILEWLFNPSYGLRQLIPEKLWEHTVLKHCVYFIHFTDYVLRRGQAWLDTLMHKLHTCPDFDRIWSKSLEEVKESQFERHDFFITFSKNGREHKFVMTEAQVNSMPRFLLVEYFPYRG
jgi:transcriptional regulator with XRE-family HTH domain